MLYIDEKDKIFILQLDEKMHFYNKVIASKSPGVRHSLWTFPRITWESNYLVSAQYSRVFEWSSEVAFFDWNLLWMFLFWQECLKAKDCGSFQSMRMSEKGREVEDLPHYVVQQIALNTHSES